MSTMSLDSYFPGDYNPSQAANDAAPDFSEPIPDGWYTATIKRAEMRQTKDGTGTMLAVGVQVTGPSHAGKYIWANINLRNRSEQATRIGHAQFGQLCVASGFPNRPPRDANALIGREIEVKVGTEEFNGRRENKAKGFRIPQGGPPRTAAAFSAPAQATAPQPKKNPWG